MDCWPTMMEPCSPDHAETPTKPHGKFARGFLLPSFRPPAQMRKAKGGNGGLLAGTAQVYADEKWKTPRERHKASGPRHRQEIGRWRWTVPGY